MTNTLVLNRTITRTTETLLRFAQTSLMILGALFVLASIYVYVDKPDLGSWLGGSQEETANEPAEKITVVEADSTQLSPRLQAALEYSARRYRVSPQALIPIFEAAQQSADELGLDPLLIISVIAVESSFNPLSESVMGAQGLMQVIPRFHKEKLPSDAGELPLFDPVINVAVGTKVLHEYINRRGSVVNGLLQFNGSLNDPSQAYANKVLAVKERMENAARRPASTNA